ncbi:TPA: hypothetical protein U1C15_001349 [Streptococcus suis]|nr:hypothetical protein [Streptococcus suis]
MKTRKRRKPGERLYQPVHQDCFTRRLKTMERRKPGDRLYQPVHQD